MFFQRLTLVCIPEPESIDMGFGIMVAILPYFWAMLRMTNLYDCVESAELVSLSYMMSISHCPAVATSWWWLSHSIPKSSVSTLTHSLRNGVSVSDGVLG